MLRVSCWAVFTLSALGILSCSGCSKSMPATVSGQILIEGQAPSGYLSGEVMFHPTGGGAAALAPLESDGKYTISTGATKGLEPGPYEVTVRVAETDPKPPGGYKSPPAQRMLSHGRYQIRGQSGLTADVQPGKNEIDFDLEAK